MSFRLLYLITLLLLPFVLTGCGTLFRSNSAPTSNAGHGGYYLDDGPGESPPEHLEQIPDAVPRAEPLHKFANKPYTAMGQVYTPDLSGKPYMARGIASWYGKRYHNQKTSSGELYDMYGMTGAHPTLPIPCYVRVTNLTNHKSVVIRINDRGPFRSNRIIDLSYTAAWKLGYANAGSAEVEVQQLFPK
jgi:rare lipoprotein A